MVAFEIADAFGMTRLVRLEKQVFSVGQDQSGQRPRSQYAVSAHDAEAFDVQLVR